MMLLIALIAGGLLLVGIGGKGYLLGVDHEKAVVAAVQAKIAAKEAELQKASDEKVAAAANTITDMEAAYEAGQSKARIKYVRIQTQVAQDIASTPSMSSVVCSIPAPLVSNLRGAFSGLLAAADTASPVAAVPAGSAAAGAAGTGHDGGATVRVDTQAAGAVAGVQGQQGATGGGGQVPGPGVRGEGHAKPVPVGK